MAYQFKMASPGLPGTAPAYAVALAVPNGGTTYTIGDLTPVTPIYPAASVYYVNGLKRIYGLYYSISGSTLTILSINPPQTGDTHELYAS